MAKLGGLDAASVAAKKGVVNEEELEKFIRGAPVQAQAEQALPLKATVQTDTPSKPPPKKAKKATFTRTNFSLSDKVNKQIDQLSLAPRTFKASRSDVVRAGVAALKAMPRADLVKLLAEVVGADSDEESAQEE